MARVHGHLFAASREKKLDHEDLVEMAAAIMSNVHRQKFKDSQEVDLAYSVPGRARFRVNLYRQRDALGAAFRIIPFEIRKL